MKTSFLSIALFVLVTACNNTANDSVEQADSANQAKLDSPSQSQPIAADEATASFLVDAANGGMAEVEMGGLAQQKAVNPEVKQFGAMMTQDHSGANAKVKALAAQRNVTLPMTMGDDHRAQKEELDKKTGAEFDRAYMKAMVNYHEDDIKKFEDAAEKISDNEVKTFITSTLPTLRTHLDSAKAIQKRIK